MKDTICSLIIFNENHIGHILLKKYEEKLFLPNLYTSQNENLLECVKRIGKEVLGLETKNEILAYIIEEKEIRTYIFICNTNSEPDSNDEWLLGSEETINSINEVELLKEDLIERFKNGFLLDGIRQIKVED